MKEKYGVKIHNSWEDKSTIVEVGDKNAAWTEALDLAGLESVNVILKNKGPIRCWAKDMSQFVIHCEGDNTECYFDVVPIIENPRKALVFTNGTGRIPNAIRDMFSKEELDELVLSIPKRMDEIILNKIREATIEVNNGSLWDLCSANKHKLYRDKSFGDSPDGAEIYVGWGYRAPCTITMWPVEEGVQWSIIENNGYEALYFFSGPDDTGCLKIKDKF